jgi:hypothetical protein
MKEDIIKMAQACWPSDRRMWAVDADLPRLERFAALVAAAEREACADIIDALNQAKDALHMATLPFPIDEVKTQRALEAVWKVCDAFAREQT